MYHHHRRPHAHDYGHGHGHGQHEHHNYRSPRQRERSISRSSSSPSPPPPSASTSHRSKDRDRDRDSDGPAVNGIPQPHSHVHAGGSITSRGAGSTGGSGTRVGGGTVHGNASAGGSGSGGGTAGRGKRRASSNRSHGTAGAGAGAGSGGVGGTPSGQYSHGRSGFLRSGGLRVQMDKIRDIYSNQPVASTSSSSSYTPRQIPYTSSSTFSPDPPGPLDSPISPGSPTSPALSWDDADGGFSTQYGASASSPGGDSGSEKEMDRFVSARGEDTETEHGSSQSKGQGLDWRGDYDGTNGLSYGGEVPSVNGGAKFGSSPLRSEIMGEGRPPSDSLFSSPPASAASFRQSFPRDRTRHGGHQTHHHPLPHHFTILPIRLGLRSIRRPITKDQISGKPEGQATYAKLDLKGKRRAADVPDPGYNLTRRRCEDGLVLGAVLFGIWKLGHQWQEKALAGEIGLLVGLSVIYTAFRARPVRKPSRPASSNMSGHSVGHVYRPGSPAITALNSNANHNDSHIHNHVRERSGRSASNHTSAAGLHREEHRLKNAQAQSSNVQVDEGDTVVGGNGCVWGTEEREYRECLDDGVFFALLLAPLIASAMLHASLSRLSEYPKSAISDGWMIESPLVLPSTPIRWLTPASPSRESDPMLVEAFVSDAIKALSALATSRRNLVQLFTLCSFVLLVQLGWSLRLEYRLARTQSLGSYSSSPIAAGLDHHSDHTKVQSHSSDGVSGTTGGTGTGTYWLRKGKWRRNLSAVGMGFVITAGCIVVKVATAYIGHGVWSDMSPSDIVIATLFYQFSLYVCVRLARRGFTLGELAVVCNAATALFMETVNLTRMKIRILRTPYIKTYRLPTPLLIFQLALIPGSLLAGFLLSPLLYLSRHLAQRPAHRLRFPHEKSMHRRLLALGFYAGAALVCGGLVGTWTAWCLGRNPFSWIIYWLAAGRRVWTRPALISYWGLLAAISVAGWNRQLVRGRRHRRYVVPGTREVTVVPGHAPSNATGSVPGGIGSGMNAPPNSANGGVVMPEGITGVATQMMDAADQKMPILSVNARRKYFHALAVVMFVPGIAFDPAFTHLSFSVAFAAFNFAEYIRYFALWPFGVSVHLFLNEFLDGKDSGTAILSHFYLLAGCASPLWLEGPSEVMHYFGVLSLGLGDAMASIVGRKFGRLRWSRASGKTVEGSVAFLGSVLLSTGLLWLCGLVKDFNVTAYVGMTFLSTLLEAFSAQNDNLILPMYGWAVGTLLGV